MSESTSTVASLWGRYKELNLAFVDQGLVSGCNFLVGVLVARSLGLDHYGVYTLIWMGVLFLNGQHHAFIVSPMMSFAPKLDEHDRPAYYGGVVIQHLLVSVAALLFLGIALLLTDYFIPDWEGSSLAPAVCAAAFAYQSQDALRRHFFVRETPGDALLIDSIGYGSQVALLIAFFTLTEPRTVLVFWAVAGGMGIGALVGAFRLNVTFPDRAGVLDGLARHWRFAKWLIGSELMRWTSENFFVIISGAALGPFAAGVMNAAKTIMGVTHILFLGLGNIAPAGAAKAWHEGGESNLRQYLASITVYGGALTLIFAGAAALFPSFLMGMVFGAEYAEYGYALQWFAAIYMMTFLHIPLSAGLRALEHTGPLFWARGIATVITILVALPLVERYGLTGALLGSFLVNVTQQATLLFAFRRALRMCADGGGEQCVPLARGDTAEVFLEPGGVIRKVYRPNEGEGGNILTVARSEYEALQKLEGIESVDTPRAIEFIEGEPPVLRMEACPGVILRHYLRNNEVSRDEMAHISSQLVLGMIAIEGRLEGSSTDHSLNNVIYDRNEKRLWFIDFATSSHHSKRADIDGLESGLASFLENGLFETARLRNLFAFAYKKRVNALLESVLEESRRRAQRPLDYQKLADIVVERYSIMMGRAGSKRLIWYRKWGMSMFCDNFKSLLSRVGCDLPLLCVKISKNSAL